MSITIWLLFAPCLFPHASCSTDVQSNLAVVIPREKRETESQSTVNDIQFKTADLLTVHRVNNAYVQLQAYKILNRQDEWVSIGYPIFVKNQNNAIYEFTPETITANLRLLADDQREALEQVAKRKYSNVSTAFVHLIPLQSIVCTTKFVQDGKQYDLQGQVHALDRLEATLEIDCPEKTPKRNAFLARIARQSNVRWRCSFLAAGQEVQVNNLRVSASILQDVANEGDLFGPATETLVTRKQMNQLAQKIRTKLNVEEGYEVDDNSDRQIIQKLLALAERTFEHVQIDDVLGRVSNFGVALNLQDVSPTEIKKVLSDIFVVRQLNNKSLIKLSNNSKASSSRNDDDSTKFNLQFGIRQLNQSAFNLSAAFDSIAKNEDKWNREGSTVNEQLDDLNWADRDNIKWAVSGNRIVPKTINVAKLTQAGIDKDFQISYRKRYIRNAQYTKKISIPTDQTVTDDVIQDIWKKIDLLNATQRQHDFKLKSLYRQTNSTATMLQRKQSFIQSYKLVCRQVKTTDYASLRGNTVVFYYNRNLYMDGFNCSMLGNEFVVQDVSVNCNSTTDSSRYISHHCFKCCRYEFSYSDAVV